MAEHFSQTNEVSHEALACPIPNMAEVRSRKRGYNDLPIDVQHERFDEPLVPLRDYGVAGQAYYSRPNAATNQPVEGVQPDVFVRRSVAQTLAEINTAIDTPVITEFFGGRVELYVEEGLRPVSLQKQLYNEVFPGLIRQQNPGISDDAMAEKRRNLIAVPSDDPLRPSPHATGGAFDLNMRYIETGESVDFGHSDADVSERAFPDYYETHDEDSVARRHRRAFYAIMSGQAFGTDTGFTCNPTEWWHWGRGDQLSETVRGSGVAYYSCKEYQPY